MRSTWVKGIFLAVVLWWAYLFFATQFVVVFDSEGYEASGHMIAYQGWAEFLHNGPQREPLFPLIVAISMRLGEWAGVSYHYPLKIIGLLFLSLTMIFSYRLMTMLAVSRWVALAFVFYMGISPTMTVTSLRLWSEFAAYPWVVLAVIWTIKSWNFLGHASLGRRGYLKTVGHASMVALMFLAFMSVKAIAEGVLLCYLWPFYWRVFTCWRSRDFLKARQVAVFCLAVLMIFEGAVCAYKACNYHYNGHFAFTNRGDFALYGNTARRMQPLTFKRLGAAAAYVPAMGICSSMFAQDDCDFWSARHSDDIIDQKRAELNAQGITGDAASKYYIHNSIKMILANPLQALLLMFIEAHKMLFWEPTLSFVAFPNWMEKVIYSTSFYNTISVIVAFFTWISCVFAFFYFCFHYCKPGLFSKERDGALFWVGNFIFWYVSLYSLYFILDRYAFSLVSLYIVLMAFLVHQITKVFFK